MSALQSSHFTRLLYFCYMKSYLFAALVLFFGLTLSSCQQNSDKKEVEKKKPLIDISSEPDQISFEDSLYKFTVEINYPVFKSSNSKAAGMLNQVVQKKIRDYRRFEVEYRDNFEEKTASLGEGARIGENDLIVNYRIIDSCERVVSLIFEVGTFYMGSAQSTFFQDCFNFDLVDMSQIYASDIFGPAEDILIPLTSMVNEKVRAAQENQCEGLSGPEELYHFVNNFNLSPRGITFHFSDFSICPFAGTDPNISFEWEEIRALTMKGVAEKYCASNS